MTSATNGTYESPSRQMDDLKMRFDKYQDCVREGYLFVEVYILSKELTLEFV